MTPAVTSSASRVVVGHLPRDRARDLTRAALPRRQWRLMQIRTAEEGERLFRRELVDAVVVDVGAVASEASRVAELAARFPSAAWIGVSPGRPVDAPALARCAELGFCDVLLDVVDDALLVPLLERRGFTPRFAAALAEPPAAFGLSMPLQRRAWRAIVGGAGRVRYAGEPARALGVTREHLSRTFAAGGAPTLKQVVDTVRVLAAAELARCPGYGVEDVCRVLRFASPKQLGIATRRALGAAPRELARATVPELVALWAARRSWDGD